MKDKKLSNRRYLKMMNERIEKRIRMKKKIRKNKEKTNKGKKKTIKERLKEATANVSDLGIGQPVPFLFGSSN